MSAAKITISLDENLLRSVDELVKANVFPSRSQAVQVSVQEKILRLRRTRLAEQCAKLNPADEQLLADLGLASEASEWPPY